MPATAQDAKGLLLSAIDDPNPVLVLEHKLLYKTSGPVTEEAIRTPIGKSHVARQGKDVVIVATGVMVSRSLEAAAALAEKGIDATVIDVRTLSPLDMEPIEQAIHLNNMSKFEDCWFDDFGKWSSYDIPCLFMDGKTLEIT